jgi:cell division protein FtsI/penicillin-binding protein 2
MLINNHHSKIDNANSSYVRLRLLLSFFILFALLVGARLAYLMIWQHNFYVALSAGTHETSGHLFPIRGQIYLQDSRTGEKYPVAMNRDYFLLFADTRAINSDEVASSTAAKLATLFNYDANRQQIIYNQLNKRTDPYEPIENKIDEETMNKIKEMNLPGISFVRKIFRFYPESNLAAAVVGFLGKDKNGSDLGNYGVEGYWQKELAGKGGFVLGPKSAVGALIPMAGGTFSPAEDGADIILTIDRALQFTTCEKMREKMIEYGATSASLLIMDPITGAIRAMCSLPDFDPNIYNQVESARVFNNNTIFTPYEPGSIFKTITMAAAVNEGVVSPQTTFVDTGSRAGLCDTPIRNAMDKSYGLQNMSQVLENSVNTGMVFVAEKLGKEKFKDYLNNFGFGTRLGLELDSEMSGSLATLSANKNNRMDCYTATASFGQGITVTPLQMVSGYSVIANGGKLLKPYIIDEIRYADGHVEKTKPKEIRQVLDKKAALLTSSMLINVVEKGHAKMAQIHGYYIGGKTGTAQIPGPGGYTAETNHTFVGIAPVDNPKFVMLVKFEKPQRLWAENTVVPVFGELTDFVLKYYGIPPTR